MKHIIRIITCVVCVAVLCSMCSLSVSASSLPDKSRTVKAVHKSREYSGFTMPYTLFLPKDYSEDKEYPIVFFLHGAGQREKDNKKQLELAVKGMYKTSPELMNTAILLAPQCPKSDQWVNYPWRNGNYSTDKVAQSRALTTALEILDKVMEDYSCDKNRLYLVGLSMGGYGSWDCLARYPERFAAAVPMCGGGDESKAEQLAEIPIWCSHCTDDPVVKYEGTQGMVEAISDAGGEYINFTSIESKKHDGWTCMATDPEVLSWLFSQDRGERVTRLTTEQAQVITDGAHQAVEQITEGVIHTLAQELHKAMGAK